MGSSAVSFKEREGRRAIQIQILLRNLGIRVAVIYELRAQGMQHVCQRGWVSQLPMIRVFYPFHHE